MTETVEKGESGWANLALKLLIAIFIFPVLVLTFHIMLMLPSAFPGVLLVHFAGNVELWGKILSAVALLLSCWGAVAVCRLIWPVSK